MKAIWNKEVLGESDNTVVVENNYYFPKSSLRMEFFVQSETTTNCPWKGDANYFSIIVNGKKNKDAAWYYEEPMKAAQEIRGCVAFWRGVEVME